MGRGPTGGSCARCEKVHSREAEEVVLCTCQWSPAAFCDHDEQQRRGVLVNVVGGDSRRQVRAIGIEARPSGVGRERLRRLSATAAHKSANDVVNNADELNIGPRFYGCGLSAGPPRARARDGVDVVGTRDEGARYNAFIDD